MVKVDRAPVVILGSGPAGYTAAIYAARAALEPMVVHGLQPGGQLTITTDVENYPGFAETIQGPWLMEQMRDQAQRFGTRFVGDTVVAVNLDRRPFVCTGDMGDEYLADTLVICTGAQARWLGIPGEETFKGFGVSACATCDGFFFRGKEVIVIGGGNTAVEESLFLANHAAKVTLIHRRSALRAERILQDRLFANQEIGVIWDTVVQEILGTESPLGVTGVAARNVVTGSEETILTDGVFVAIGHDPTTGIFRDWLDMDEHGYITTAPDSTATSVPGVYAAGDVKDRVFRQAVTAAGMGCMAALEAEKYLAERQSEGETHAAE